MRNAIYSGPFVTQAKQEFSNSGSAKQQKWQSYIKGVVNRQDILQEALNWLVKEILIPICHSIGMIQTLMI